MSQTLILPRPLIISGPCSAESETQVMETARLLKASGQVHLFRAGLWKPRTRPGSFSGVGEEGLPWLQKVTQETGLPVCTEVALPLHVEQCLRHGITTFWIGARTVSNPFSVQELAEALAGTHVCVMIKNPLHPDFDLWTGAIERFQKAGLHNLVAIHRGFYPFEKSGMRNTPKWELAIDMKSRFPELPLICDISHLAGNRTNLQPVAQKALDLEMDGLMIECHINPSLALSDARQQITPEELNNLLHNLTFRDDTTPAPERHQKLEMLRNQVDSIDEQIIDLMSGRMKLIETIGTYKKEHNIAILQVKRWNEIIASRTRQARKGGLSAAFLEKVLKAIHQESIRKQSLIYKKRQDTRDKTQEK